MLVFFGSYDNDIAMTANIQFLDWAIIASYVVITLGIGLYFRKRASTDIAQYFLSGRSFPWWLAGTSMVATTFAVDTPLAVTGLVARNGIAGNWFWWTQAFSTVTVCFFFAKWWRRAEVLTDVEFIELRYSDRSGAFLRGFAALYRGLLLAGIKLAWVIVAMMKVLDAVFGFDKTVTLAICVAIVIVYSVLSGFWGVVITDFIQFVIAMVGTIIFAFIALGKVGGTSGLVDKLTIQYGAERTSELFAVFPFDSSWMPLSVLFVFIGLMWWADPRVEGGAYIAQRIMSTKNERHALLSTLWFNVAHYALRPWPWIVVALVAMVYYPELKDKEMGYPMLMAQILPSGVIGLLVVSFLAAFMSTVDTLANWGTSYLINDFYKRFLHKNGSTKHYVYASKIAEVVLILVAFFISFHVNSIVGMWKLLVSLTTGLGVVYIARWMWWRVNAWSEVSAMCSSLILGFIFNAKTIMPAVLYESGLSWPFIGGLINVASTYKFHEQILIIVPITTIIWVTVTFLTSPVSEEKLITFYTRVKPFPKFWKPIVKNIPENLRPQKGEFWRSAKCWVLGISLVYGSMVAIGKWIFKVHTQAGIATFIAVLAGILLWRELAKGKLIEE